MEEAFARDRLFARVVADFGPAIWRLTAGYSSDEDDREDLRQDILVAVWRALPSFEGRSSLKTFIYRVAHNRGVSHRSRRLHRGHDRMSTPMPDPRPGPDENLVTIQRREKLHEAIRRLPLTLRHVVMLRLDGLAYGEISEVLGISENNVGVRLNRARTRLSELLNEETVT